jgi:hypothetical protein
MEKRGGFASEIILRPFAFLGALAECGSRARLRPFARAMCESFWSLSGRLQLIWDSPIVAGAVLAMLSPWLQAPMGWVAEGTWKKLLVGVSILVEAVVLGCLVLTQSRGPLIAWIVAMVGCIAMARGIAPVLRQRITMRVTAALALVVIGVEFTAVRARMTNAISLQDQSVGNRLQIWSASLDMLWLNPLTGLGSGEAGWTYSQWFQPDTSHYLYTGVLNGFLETGIEHGVIILWFVLTSAAAMLLSPWFVFRSENATRQSEAAVTLGLYSWTSLAVFFLTNISSSMHKTSVVVALSAAALAGLTGFLAKARDWQAIVRAFRWSATIATTVLLLLWWLPPLRVPLSAVAVTWDNGVIGLSSEKKLKKSPPVVALVDRSALGPLFGQPVRDILINEPGLNSLSVLDPRFPLEPGRLVAATRIILTGRSLRFLRNLDPARSLDLLVIHPQGAPVDFPERWTVRIVLPGIDELGQNASWIAAAHPPRVTAEVRGRSGQLIQCASDR